jgi:MSHA biogenesis protein MshO
MMTRRQLQGFTLVEMIVVIVITGIIGGIVAIFLRSPVQGYVDSARRAELTDIADTALRRISRDLHLSLPNSVRVTGTCSGATTCYVEFIPTTGGGRYRDSKSSLGAGDILDFSVADTSFDVLGTMPTVNVGDQIVVYNLGIAGADAYTGNTGAADVRRVVSNVGANNISIASGNKLPFDSCQYDTSGYVVGGCRFQVVQTAVSYACDPVAGTLTRWQGYTIQAAQPTASPGGTTAKMATNVSACSFNYAVGASQRSSLMTIHLTITEQGESVNLYAATHVNNVP